MEVIPIKQRKEFIALCILHVCGGDPKSGRLAYSLLRVFSTYVEVIPGLRFAEVLGLSILHVCGGDPINAHWKCEVEMYSPHMLRVLLSLSAQINSL